MAFFNKKTALLYLSAFFLIAFDRFLKTLAIEGGFERAIVSDFFTFTFTANKNIAFSLPVTGVFLIILIVVILIFLLVQYFHLVRHNEKIFSSALVFLILGAFSNLYDRLRFGFVVDYLYLKYFTVFNIADAMIVVAAIFIIIYQLRKDRLLLSSSR